MLAQAPVPVPPPVQHVHFTWTNLDSSIPGVALHIDNNLVLPRAVVPDDKGGTFVADTGTGKLTSYDSFGRLSSANHPQVIVAVPAAGNGLGSPTGLVLNHAAFALTPGDDFTITSGANTGPSKFLTCTADGTIAGYNAAVDAMNAIQMVTTFGANYQGLALSRDSQGHHRLYVANFGGTGSIDVFDHTFTPVVVAGGFVDPNAVLGYAPYNIKHYAYTDHTTHKVVRRLLVAYAPQNLTPGGNAGYIDVFDTDGGFVKRLVDQSGSNGLNLPWGMAIARHEPGRHDDVLLVANHGDGTVSRYRLGGDFSGTPLGSALRPTGELLQFGGLWALHFGEVAPRRPEALALSEDELGEVETALHFTADLNSTTDGLAGLIFRR